MSKSRNLVEAGSALMERVSFADLLRVSEPKRVARSRTVHGGPLKVDAYENAMYYGFNVKSNPSTTHLRHRGYIKLFKPTRPMAMKNVPCEVDCDCPDFRYRWAWVDKQLGSSRVGPNSMNQALNRAPRITNPTGRPGLCKHIIALRDYLKGQMAPRDFVGTGRDSGIMLSQLVKRSQNLWIDYEGAMVKAKEREQRYRGRSDARRRGEPPPDEPPSDEPGGTPAAPPPAPPTGPLTPGVGRRPRPEPRLDEPPEPPESDSFPESVDNPTVNSMNTKIAEILPTLAEVATSIRMRECGGEMPMGPGDQETPEDKGEELLQILRDIDSKLAVLAGTEEPELDGHDEPEMPHHAPGEDEGVPEFGDEPNAEEDLRPEQSHVNKLKH